MFLLNFLFLLVCAVLFLVISLKKDLVNSFKELFFKDSYLGIFCKCLVEVEGVVLLVGLLVVIIFFIKKPIYLFIFIYCIIIWVLLVPLVFSLILAKLDLIFQNKTKRFGDLCNFIYLHFNINPKVILSSMLDFPHMDKIKLAEKFIFAYVTLNIFSCIIRWKSYVGVLTLTESQYLINNCNSVSWLFLVSSMLMFTRYYKAYFLVELSYSENPCGTFKYLCIFSKLVQTWFRIFLSIVLFNFICVIVLDVNMPEYIIQIIKNPRISDQIILLDFIHDVSFNLERVVSFWLNKIKPFYYSISYPSITFNFLLIFFSKKPKFNQKRFFGKEIVAKVIAKGSATVIEDKSNGKTWLEVCVSFLDSSPNQTSNTVSNMSIEQKNYQVSLGEKQIPILGPDGSRSGLKGCCAGTDAERYRAHHARRYRLEKDFKNRHVFPLLINKDTSSSYSTDWQNSSQQEYTRNDSGTNAVILGYIATLGGTLAVVATIACGVQASVALYDRFNPPDVASKSLVLTDSNIIVGEDLKNNKVIPKQKIENKLLVNQKNPGVLQSEAKLKQARIDEVGRILKELK